MSFKSVIIAGAGGNLGPAILNAFLHHSAFTISVLTRPTSTSTFPAGVRVLKADYNSAAELRAAFAGQDVVVSLVGGMALGDQNALIDAAIAAGVQRFVPSEFGSDVPNARVRELVPFFDAKYQVVQYLKSKEDAISWTSVIPGPFLDWGIKSGFIGFNTATKTAQLYDEGKGRLATTNVGQIGLAVVRALERGEQSKNQYVYVAGFRTSQAEILATFEKVSGEKWAVEHFSAEEALKEGSEKFAKGDHSGIPPLLLGMNLGAKENLGDHSVAGLWNEKLGLEQESLEDTVRAALSGKYLYEV